VAAESDRESEKVVPKSGDTIKRRLWGSRQGRARDRDLGQSESAGTQVAVAGRNRNRKVRKGKVLMSRNISGKLMLALAVGSVMILGIARDRAAADGDIPIEGTFTQNEPCRGDGSQQKLQVVKITPKDVSYSGGVCSIDDKQQDGNNLAMRVTCKFKSGAVLASAVTFTQKDNNTFDMAQQDGTYRAVLYRCPG
jgi:hypothetical protein